MGLELTRRGLMGAAGAGGAALALGARPAAPSSAAEPPLFGPARGIARLSLNENPYGPSPSAMAAMADVATKGCYYADSGYKKLTAMIAERFGVTPAHVVLSSGSSEVLAAIALLTAGKGTTVAPELYFDTSTVYGERRGGRTIRVPMRPDMGIDLDGMAAAVGPDTALVHICNPNNPTGMLIDGPTMTAFVQKVSPQATVLIDEAYNELTEVPEASSVVPLVRSGANVIVCRTFSKLYGMAGLRVGYAIMQPDMAEQVRGYLMTFGGSSAGLAAAIASFNDATFIRFSKERIVEARGIILDAVKSAGLSALPSQANFVFVKVPDANAVRAAMAERDIMIRGAYGKWISYSRVSTGRIEDVKRYAQALPRVLRA